GGDSEENEEGIEDAGAAGERMDFSVTHRGHSGKGHIEGVERRIAVDHREPDGPDGEGGDDRHRDEEKAAREPAHEGVRISIAVCRGDSTRGPQLHTDPESAVMRIAVADDAGAIETDAVDADLGSGLDGARGTKTTTGLRHVG